MEDRMGDKLGMLPKTRLEAAHLMVFLWYWIINILFRVICLLGDASEIEY
jgi:hypothetical protein